MNETALLAMLPTPQRLALSYAPRAARLPTLAVMAFDVRLAAIVRATHEPLLGQIRLAWWRDRLIEGPESWPHGEPVLQALAGWGEAAAQMRALVDGWEALLGDDSARVGRLSSARSSAFGVLAERLGVGTRQAKQAAYGWSLVDCAQNLADPELVDETAALIGQTEWPELRLARALRPLQVLYGLARRERSADRPQLLGSPGAGIAAMRIGLFGR